MKKNVTLSLTALQQLEDWKSSDPKTLVKIIALIIETAESPFTGTGKPEALKYDLKGKWSRRINLEHRLVHEVKDDSIWIISCRHHYE